ncbi:MAG: GMC family oxidoreductase N-terminal domain-containing protein [Ilumatobacteraceae bacterium]
MRWVVVGAGAAGCVMAARLVEAGEEVVLVEAGSATPATDSTGGRSFFDAIATPGRVFPGPFLRGRGVGGSSTVNGMIATRGDEAQYRAWGWDDTVAAFARVRVPTEPAPDDELGPIDLALLAAAPDCIRPLLTRRGGRRVTAFEAYLGDAATTVTGRIDLLADAPASRVVMRGDRATGVHLADGTIVEADAVVVSAGAIGSPLLLFASGVGGSHVGRHLRNHAALPVDVLLRPDVAVDPHGLVSATLLRRDDLQVLPVNHLGPTEPGGTAGFLVMAMEATGNGHVHPGDEADPVVAPVLSDDDHRRLAAGIALVHELLAHPALRAIVTDVEVGDAPAGVYHATSTCRMGDVVDDDAAVLGCRQLFVVDASIFPGLPSTNTYLPTLMLAERMVAKVLRSAQDGF